MKSKKNLPPYAKKVGKYTTCISVAVRKESA
jgi:hypothetical protein